MSISEPRACGRCGARVESQAHSTGADGEVTWIWRCACGWCRLKTATGAVTRASALEDIEKSRRGE